MKKIVVFVFVLSVACAGVVASMEKNNKKSEDSGSRGMTVYEIETMRLNDVYSKMADELGKAKNLQEFIKSNQKY